MPSGRFSCSKCPSKGSAIAEYIFMLLAQLLLNVYLIVQLSRATMHDFAAVQGSDYLQVRSLALEWCNGFRVVLHAHAHACAHHMSARHTAQQQGKPSLASFGLLAWCMA